VSRFALRFVSGRYQGMEYPLPDSGEVMVGRAVDLDLVLLEDKISRKHAKFVTSGGGLLLTDLGSTNGSYVNGDKVRRIELSFEDRVLLGTCIMRIVSGDNIQLNPDIAADRESLRAMMRDRESVSRANDLSGVLGEVPLCELFTCILTGQKTGALLVSGERETTLFFRDGELCHIEVAGMEEFSRQKVMVRLLSWNAGEYRFDEDATSPTEFNLVFGDGAELISESQRHAAEIPRLLEVLPPLDMPLTMCVPLMPKLSDLDAPQLDTLRLALNFPTLGEVIDHCPDSDYVVMSHLHQLLADGYLEVDPDIAVL